MINPPISSGCHSLPFLPSLPSLPTNSLVDCGTCTTLPLLFHDMCGGIDIVDGCMDGCMDGEYCVCVVCVLPCQSAVSYRWSPQITVS